MKSCTFNQIWDDSHENRDIILEEYMADDYLSHLLTEEEIIYIRDTIEAAAQSRTLDEFCDAIKTNSDNIAEEFEIPYSEIDRWREGELPSYIKRMIVYFAISNEIEYRRTRTCQSCGSFFFSADNKEQCCNHCRSKMANSFFDYYLAMRDDPNIG